MDSPKPRIYLDRLEVVIVFSLFILVAGMMFTFGVLVGHGIGMRDVAAHLSETAEKVVAEGHEEPEKGKSGGRSPASVGAAKVQTAGGELRQAFRESKQRALVELALRDNVPSRPKSVLDSEAHFNSHSEWDRRPAGQQESDEDLADIEAAHTQDEAKEKAGVPTVVKGLFERRPATADTFSPKPGSFTVQVASYATKDESSAKVTGLRRSGYNDAYYETTKIKNGETWYRVAVGSFPTAQWAHKTGDRLVRRGLAHDYVVRQVP